MKHFGHITLELLHSVLHQQNIKKDLDKSNDDDKKKNQDAFAVQVAQTKTLQLGFKDIKTVDNLHGFHTLTTLKLNNNRIQKIENLSSLVSLQWLDLSFNEIDIIQGLETMTLLEDLSLFHNRIKTLECGICFDNLRRLQFLSLGKNHIGAVEDSDDFYYQLKKLTSLRALTLQGNPICIDDPKFENKVAASLPLLVYLDYKRTNKKSTVVATMANNFDVDSSSYHVNESKENEKEEEAIEFEQSTLRCLSSALFNAQTKTSQCDLKSISTIQNRIDEAISKINDAHAILVQSLNPLKIETDLIIQNFKDKVQVLRSKATSETLAVIQEFRKNHCKNLTAGSNNMEETAKLHETLMSYSLTNSKEMNNVLDIFKEKTNDMINCKLDLHNELYFNIIVKIGGDCFEDIQNILDANFSNEFQCTDDFGVAELVALYFKELNSMETLFGTQLDQSIILTDKKERENMHHVTSQLCKKEHEWSRRFVVELLEIRKEFNFCS